MSAARYKIGMLTPYSWTVPTSVNRHVQALAERFSALGHQVTVIAPSDDKAALRAARRRVRFSGFSSSTMICPLVKTHISLAILTDSRAISLADSLVWRSRARAAESA